MTVGTPMVYAAIHHHGGETSLNHAVTIPARPVLGMSASDAREIADMAEDYNQNTELT
ncbi:MAG: phage virion morphogenesis protein [Marinovum sp.]|nr:phage virion morphogenesis protein [Marinovum sp.]